MSLQSNKPPYMQIKSRCDLNYESYLTTCTDKLNVHCLPNKMYYDHQIQTPYRSIVITSQTVQNKGFGKTALLKRDLTVTNADNITYNK